MNYLEFEEPIRQLREQLTQARDLQEQVTSTWSRSPKI